MNAWKRRVFAVAASLTILTSCAVSNVAAMAPVPGYNLTGITVDEVRQQAIIQLQNAQAAGRIAPESASQLHTNLQNASSIDQIEKTWTDLEAEAQNAKSEHVSIDHLTTTFSRYLESLRKKGTISSEAYISYSDRIKAIARLKKTFVNKNNNFYDFWNFVDLAIDISSLQERLMRALSDQDPPLETLNQLLLRTDNYLARNDLSARQLTVYKSFEVEPDELRQSKEILWTYLKDKAHSRTQTPWVRQQLYKRLFAIQYQAGKTMPSEADITKAIAEVQRLLDAGAINGNLMADDDVRIRHELELIKKIRTSYPGPNPGIDPVEKELRGEEVRFMSLDLRFLQDWLGRVLRKDGEVAEGREQVLRAVRRIDLAYTSHRITDTDMNSLIDSLNDSIKNASNDADLVASCRALEGRMDMMVSDYSMVPANAELRLKNITAMIARLSGESQAVSNNDRNRIQQFLARTTGGTAAQKYGASIVASAELEMLRGKIKRALKYQ